MCDIDRNQARKFHCPMMNIQKACPVVTRTSRGSLEVLAFIHPLAGRQFVKGTIEKGETPSDAAKRELFEESGLLCFDPMEPLGRAPIGPDQTTWHFYRWHSTGLLNTWSHAAKDDLGHIFTFFWHPIDLTLDESWHPTFHEAFCFLAGVIRER